MKEEKEMEKGREECRQKRTSRKDNSFSFNVKIREMLIFISVQYFRNTGPY